MKTIGLSVMAVVAMSLVSGCVMTQTEFKQRQNAVYETWIGHHKSELIQKMGPPTSVASDGQGGEILIFDRSKTTQTQGTATINPYWNTITYDNPQMEKTEVYEQFYCDRNGRIYNFRWKNSYYSGSHSEYVATNKGGASQQEGKSSAINPVTDTNTTFTIKGVTYNASTDTASIRSKAEAGDPEFQNFLGCMYDKGLGVSQDFTEALKWFRKAADQGLAKAQCNVGMMYDDGRGVAKDDAEALSWYRKAADRGSEDAQRNLGVMYHLGRGVTQDDIEARKWFQRAADQGEGAAQCAMGIMYALGEGGTQDDVEAYRWYSLASAEVIIAEEAINNRNVLLKRMTSEQIAEGQRLVSEWKPKPEVTADDSLNTQVTKDTARDKSLPTKERLRELKELRDQRLINEETYKRKEADILKDL